MLFDRLDRFTAQLGRYTLRISIAALIFVMLLIVVDAVSRKVKTAGGIVGGIEVVQFALVVGIFASFAFCQSCHAHVRVLMLVMHFPEKIRFIIYSFGCAIGVFIVGVMVYASASQAYYSLNMKTISAILYVPLYPFYIIESVCMLLYLLTILWDLIKGIAALKSQRIAKEIQKDWL
jgi:TRAP-type C4-dicarboxylate transport system permease small subunit